MLQQDCKNHKANRKSVMDKSGGIQMSKCPMCGTPMRREQKEIQEGIYAQVEVCPKCNNEWIDEKEYEILYKMFTQKAFMIGRSLAVRIPKELANVIGLKEGSNVKLVVKDKKLVIEPA
jgi:antitoxin MazE